MMSSLSSSSDCFSSESDSENRLTRTSKKCKLERKEKTTQKWDSTDNIRWVRSSNMPSHCAQSSSRSPSPMSSKPS